MELISCFVPNTGIKVDVQRIRALVDNSVEVSIKPAVSKLHSRDVVVQPVQIKTAKFDTGDSATARERRDIADPVL
eukprot:SAG22_NODE_18902_length_280_cov_0.839779_1_plen_75_part_10